jgi:hypothetical protein
LRLPNEPLAELLYKSGVDGEIDCMLEQ